MLNRSEILRSAWASYRRDAKQGLGVAKGAPFSRSHFAYCLRMAWLCAKQTMAKAARVEAPIVVKPVTCPVKLARIEAINNELLGLELADFVDWTQHDALQVELARINQAEWRIEGHRTTSGKREWIIAYGLNTYGDGPEGYVGHVEASPEEVAELITRHNSTIQVAAAL